MKWFKPEVVYKVLEVEKPTPVLHKEDSSNIAQLAEHPGFKSLLARLRIQKAAIENELKTTRHESLDAVYNLQAGIRWINWLDKQVSTAANRKEIQPRDAFDLEEAEFRRVAAALEIIGKVNGKTI